MGKVSHYEEISQWVNIITFKTEGDENYQDEVGLTRVAISFKENSFLFITQNNDQICIKEIAQTFEEINLGKDNKELS